MRRSVPVTIYLGGKPLTTAHATPVVLFYATVGSACDELAEQ